ncbi:hypothetical protein L1080_037255 [Rhodococcus sp. MSC1_016]|jgi:hypothetical protein|uniref:hypothetical protein n=1 Tax=Rhodococcus sp. MSC1_016 TaxID=2909266 RepID=UPI0020302278|nr:hypothetical protein [Rhodococcus sp. MSC1_016]
MVFPSLGVTTTARPVVESASTWALCSQAEWARACGMGMYSGMITILGKGQLRMTTHILRIEGRHCGSYALLIDDTLEDLHNMANTHTSMKKGRSA